MILLGRRSCLTTSITSRPASSATWPFLPSSAGTIDEPTGEMPRISNASAIVLAVNWPPHAPGPGEAALSSSLSSSSSILPAAWAPTASKTSWIVTSLPLKRPGADRAAVEHHAGDVEAGQRHHAAGDRLVAARQGDHAVEHVAPGNQLDRVGDDLAADQRGAHALGAHRDPVRHGHGVELHRRAAGGPHALLDPLRQAAQVEVAGHDLGPRVGDADDRPRQRLVVVADALQVRARGGPVRALELDPAARAGVDAHWRLGLDRAVRPAAALPLGQAPEVAPHPRGVELAADQVHVGLADHAALVRGQRHPLGQHVVRRGQPRVAVAVQVGELDAVLAQQAAVLGHVGHDRLVRVDQVGVAGRGAARGRCARPGARPGTRRKPEVAVHRPLLLVHARAQQLAGALLGAALAARVVGHRRRRGRLGVDAAAACGPRDGPSPSARPGARPGPLPPRP